MDKAVFPTHVGMNRNLPRTVLDGRCIPHARGDEPEFAQNGIRWKVYSPRTWG